MKAKVNKLPERKKVSLLALVLFLCWISFWIGRSAIGSRLDASKVLVNGKLSHCRVYETPFHELIIVGLDDEYTMLREGDMRVVGWDGYEFELGGAIYDLLPESVELPSPRYFRSWRPQFSGKEDHFKFVTRDNRSVEVQVSE